MVSELGCRKVLDYLPSSLYRHPAWIAWKASQGWEPIKASEGIVPLSRKLGPGTSMVYATAPSSLFDQGAADEDEDPDYGAALEGLSLELLSYLPGDCAFIRWDLMLPAWTDAQGQALDTRLQEMRMNAPTRHRRFRKAYSEASCLDTMVVGLDGGPGAIDSGLDYRTSYSVRLASRRGTAVRRAGEAGLPAFHGLQRKTAARHGLPLHPEASYRGLFRAAREEGLSLDLYLAELGGEAAASAIIARHGGDAWYLFAASSPEHRAAAGPTAILHRALHDCEEAGDGRMDLLGVGPLGARDHPLSGLSLFKSGFGGRRRARAGAWDFVLDAQVHGAWAQRELG